MKKIRRKAVGMMSLIDVVFLLLIFFLIVSVFINSEKREYVVKVLTPETRPGVANVLIQVLENGQFLYLDSDYFVALDKFMGEQAYLGYWGRGDSFQSGKYKLFFKSLFAGEVTFGPTKAELRNDMLKVMNEATVRKKIRETVEEIGKYNDSHMDVMELMFLVRCPKTEPYGQALVIVDAINQAKIGVSAIKYGISGGTPGQLIDEHSGSFKFAAGEAGQDPAMVIKFGR